MSKITPRAFRREKLRFDLSVTGNTSRDAKLVTKTLHDGTKLELALPPGMCVWASDLGPNGNFQRGDYGADTLDKAEFKGDLSERLPGMTTPSTEHICKPNDGGTNAAVTHLFDEVLAPMAADALDAMVAFFMDLPASSVFFQGPKMQLYVPELGDAAAVRKRLRESFTPLVKTGTRDKVRYISVATSVFRKLDEKDKARAAKSGLAAAGAGVSEDDEMYQKGFRRTPLRKFNAAARPIAPGSADDVICDGDVVSYDVAPNIWIMRATGSWGIKLWLNSVQVVGRGSGGGGGASGFTDWTAQHDEQGAQRAANGADDTHPVPFVPQKLAAAPPPAAAAGYAESASDDDDDADDASGGDASDDDAPPPPPKKAAAPPPKKAAAPPPPADKKRKAAPPPADDDGDDYSGGADDAPPPPPPKKAAAAPPPASKKPKKAAAAAATDDE